MSETTQSGANEPVAANFAGWIVSDETSDRLNLTHSDGRTLSVKVLDMADLLDLMEAAGTVSTNQGWMNLAIPAVSVDVINGVPVSPPQTKDKIKQRVRELGNERMGAVIWALFQRPPTTSDRDVAKN